VVSKRKALLVEIGRWFDFDFQDDAPPTANGPANGPAVNQQTDAERNGKKPLCNQGDDPVGSLVLGGMDAFVLPAKPSQRAWQSFIAIFGSPCAGLRFLFLLPVCWRFVHHETCSSRKRLLALTFFFFLRTLFFLLALLVRFFGIEDAHVKKKREMEQSRLQEKRRTTRRNETFWQDATRPRFDVGHKRFRSREMRTKERSKQRDK